MSSNITIQNVVSTVQAHRCDKDGAKIERQQFSFKALDEDGNPHKCSIVVVQAEPILSASALVKCLAARAAKRLPTQIRIPAKCKPTFTLSDGTALTLEIGTSYLPTDRLMLLLGISAPAAPVSAPELVASTSKGKSK